MALRQLSVLLGARGGSLTARCAVRQRALSLSPVLSHERLREILPPLESFDKRHIGPSQEDINHMLKVIGVKVRDTHVQRVVYQAFSVLVHVPPWYSLIPPPPPSLLSSLSSLSLSLLFAHTHTHTLMHAVDGRVN